MKLVSSFINKFFPKEPIVLLGRWNIDYCEKKINKKIDLSNKDHGACLTYNNYDILYDNKKVKNYNIKSLIFFETM
jgi:hypothetical protein